MDRLSLIASLARGANTLVDVGCDNGYALIYALKNHNVNYGIAADITDGPLNQAKKNIYENNLQDRVLFIKSDGFREINQEFDTAIIAGMGGILIKDIILASLDKLNDVKLILEPNTDSNILRYNLYKNGFMIINEYAIIDGNKYYEIIVCKKGEATYSDLEIEYGPILLMKKEEAFITHYSHILNRYKEIVDLVQNEDRKKEILNKIDEISQILK